MFDFLIFTVEFHACVYSFTQPVTQSCIVQEVVMLLLSYDACATVINGTAQIPKDVTQNVDIKNMLGGK